MSGEAQRGRAAGAAGAAGAVGAVSAQGVTEAGPAGPRRLAPHLATAWRDADRIQIGASANAGVVLTGLDPDDRRVLDLLTRGVSLAALDTDARRRGSDPMRRRDLVAVLDSRRMLVPTDSPQTSSVEAVRLRSERWSWLVDQSAHRSSAARRRPTQTVRVIGGTALAVPVAAGFAASGIGSVTVTDDRIVTPADVIVGGLQADDQGRGLAAAATDALARISPRNSTSSSALADLLVVIGRDAHDADASAEWVADDRAHLAVLIRDSEIVVGPLVVPGQGPCLHCLDLHHRDRDAQWAAVLPQLLRGDRARPAGIVPALAQVAAGMAVLLGLSYLDGCDDARAGAAATVSLPLGEVTWRLWTAHPGCGCVGFDTDLDTEAMG